RVARADVAAAARDAAGHARAAAVARARVHLRVPGARLRHAHRAARELAARARAVARAVGAACRGGLRRAVVVGVGAVRHGPADAVGARALLDRRTRLADAVARRITADA